jgi:two-component system cell cycle response regulator DivK
MEKMNYSGYTLLVAEDDDNNFEYIQQIYRGTGLTILRATTGLEAVEYCRKNPDIRVVMMDGMMPVMTGYDATHEIRKFRSDLPIIILTAYVSQASIRDAVMSGCNDYMAKPIGPEELQSMLKKWMVIE